MYKLSDQADADFTAIYLYTLVEFGATQADSYMEDLEAVFKRLCDFPKLGRSCDEIIDGSRRHEHGEHTIFYREIGTDILIGRILHKRMDPHLHLDDF